MDLVGAGYYPSSNPTSYSPSPHVPTEEVEPISHVVAPTPVNLIIQTNFTRVEHNYRYDYASQESETPSGYVSTPSPTTASSTRSSFSFSSADSPTSPFAQTQDHPVDYDSQSHPAARNVYLPYQFRHQYDVVDSCCYESSPLPEQGASPCQCYPEGGLHPHEAYYPPAGDYGSPDHNRGYENEPESERGRATYPAPGYYQSYTTPNHAADAWRHSSWFHLAVAKSEDGGRDGAYDNATAYLGSVHHPTSYNIHSR